MGKLTMRRLSSMFGRFARQHDAGIDARTMWEREITMATPGSRTGLQSIHSAVSAGDSMAKAMKKSGLFPTLAYEMVQVGEKGGRLETVFKQLSEHYENLVKMRQTFLMGILWPMIQFFAAIAIFGLLILALGWVASITGSEPLDIFGLGYSPTGNFTLYCVLVCVFLGIGFLLIQGLARGWFGTLPTRIAFRIPLIGPTIRNLALARMAWSLGMAHNSGMNAIETMSLSLRATQVQYYMGYEPQLCQAIQSGKEMHHALAKTNAFPDDFVTAVATGELTGQVTETLERLSEEYNTRAKAQFAILTTLGGLLVFLFVAGVVGFLVFYLYNVMYLKPMYDALDGNI